MERAVRNMYLFMGITQGAPRGMMHYRPCTSALFTANTVPLLPDIRTLHSNVSTGHIALRYVTPSRSEPSSKKLPNSTAQFSPSKYANRKLQVLFS